MTVDGMWHIEGGWGKEINDPQDNTERVRGIGKLKALGYAPAVLRMVDKVETYIEENNSSTPHIFILIVLVY